MSEIECHGALGLPRVPRRRSAVNVLNEIATGMALSSSLTYVVVKEEKDFRTIAKT